MTTLTPSYLAALSKISRMCPAADEIDAYWCDANTAVLYAYQNTDTFLGSVYFAIGDIAEEDFDAWPYVEPFYERGAATVH